MRLGYEGKRLKDGLAGMSVSRKMKGRDTWTRQQLEDYQLEKLRALVRHAKTNSPFYREHLDAVDPDRLSSVDQLPTVDNRTMMENLGPAADTTPKSTTLSRDAEGSVQSVSVARGATWTISRNPDGSVASLADGETSVAVGRDAGGVVTGTTVT